MSLKGTWGLTSSSFAHVAPYKASVHPPLQYAALPHARKITHPAHSYINTATPMKSIYML